MFAQWWMLIGLENHAALSDSPPHPFWRVNGKLSEPFLVNGTFKATWFSTVVRLVLDPIVGLICSRKYLSSTKCRIDRRKWRVRELLRSCFFLSSSPSSTRWLPMHRARSLQDPSTTLLVVILGTNVARVQVHIHLTARCKANPPRSHYPAFFFCLPPRRRRPRRAMRPTSSVLR